MTMTTSERNSIKRDMTGVDQTLAMYREMRKVAERYGNDYEIERIERQIDEYDCVRDDVIERAIAAGMGPDDFI